MSLSPATARPAIAGTPTRKQAALARYWLMVPSPKGDVAVTAMTASSKRMAVVFFLMSSMFFSPLAENPVYIRERNRLSGLLSRTVRFPERWADRVWCESQNARRDTTLQVEIPWRASRFWRGRGDPGGVILPLFSISCHSVISFWYGNEQVSRLPPGFRVIHCVQPFSEGVGYCLSRIDILKQSHQCLD